MNRSVILIGLLLPAALVAQNAPLSSIRIYTEPEGARFYVDGSMYVASQTFLWPQGSKHIVQFPLMPDGRYQLSLDGNTRYEFNHWIDNNGYLKPSTETFQTIIASPAVTSLKADLTVSYRVMLRFSRTPVGPVNCSAPGDAPQDGVRTGIVFFDDECYGSNADVFVRPGEHILNAFPYPGAVFTGWSVNGGVADPYLRSINITGPVTVYAAFKPAKRVRFRSDPPGFKVLVDKTTTPTSAGKLVDLGNYNQTCPLNLSLSQAAPVTIPALCYGDFDFLPGSQHEVGAPSPQLDSSGKYWVFSQFSNGLGQSGVYTADSNVARADVVTAKFVPGVRVTLETTPPGLKLQVDGRDSWSNYNFVWGAGSKHTAAAPESQVDSSGRRWTFEGWSDGGPATREIVVGDGITDARYTARYSSPGRLTLLTNPPGVKLQVDGAECETPCVVDRASGVEVAISAPASPPIDNMRLEFLGWSDGKPATRTFRFNGEDQTLTANYHASYRLMAASNPPGGVDFTFDPPSSDMFYAGGTEVTVTVKARPGFKFSQWGGDVSGTYNAVRVSLNGPRSVIALLDRVPYIASAGVRNAAGVTPDDAVASGSIISIYGESLAPQLAVSERIPLDQTLAGVIVRVGDRILPLLYVSPQQINAQAPSDLPDGEYTLRVQWGENPEATAPIRIVRNAPGLFSQPVDDKLYALALHEDGSLVTLESPARRGETISILGTGFGPYDKRMADGFPFPNSPVYDLADPLQIAAGDWKLAPVWSGGAAGYVGLDVTRVQITSDLPSAATLDLRVTVNGKTSNTVLLPIE